ncbi:MAG: hypothetical protein KDB82_12815 [Planctomycetes bacterium]|nr:hypothetical protein [Planctomycetota bacterium]
MNPAYADRYRGLFRVFVLVMVLVGLGLGVGWYMPLVAIPERSGFPVSPRIVVVYGAANLFWIGVFGTVSVGILKQRRWGALGAMLVALLLITVSLTVAGAARAGGAKGADEAFEVSGCTSLLYLLLLIMGLRALVARRGPAETHVPLEQRVQSPLQYSASPYGGDGAPDPKLGLARAGVVLGVFLVLVFVALAAGLYGVTYVPRDTIDWRQYRHKEFEFTAEFPARPRVEDYPEFEGSGRVYCAGQSFWVMAACLRDPATRSDGSRVARDLERGHEQEILGDCITFDMPDELEVTDTEDFVTYGSFARRGVIHDKYSGLDGRIEAIVAGNFTYIVAGVAQDPALLDRFIESFHILGEPGYARDGEIPFERNGRWKTHPDDPIDASVHADGEPPLHWRFESDDPYLRGMSDGRDLWLAGGAQMPTDNRRLAFQWRVWDDEGRSSGAQDAIETDTRMRSETATRDGERLQKLFEALPKFLPPGQDGSHYEATIENALFEEADWSVTSYSDRNRIRVEETPGGMRVEMANPTIGDYQFNVKFTLGKATGYRAFRFEIKRVPGVFLEESFHGFAAYAGAPFLWVPELKEAVGTPKLEIIDDSAADWLRVVKTPQGLAVAGVAEFSKPMVRVTLRVSDDSGTSQQVVLSVVCFHAIAEADIVDGVRSLPAAVALSPYLQPLPGFKGGAISDVSVLAGELPGGLEAQSPRTENDLCAFRGTPRSAGDYEFTLGFETTWGETIERRFRMTVLPDGDFLGMEEPDNLYLAVEPKVWRGANSDDVINTAAAALAGRSFKQFNWQWLGVDASNQRARLPKPEQIEAEALDAVADELKRPHKAGPGYSSDIERCVDWEGVQDGAMVVIVVSPQLIQPQVFGPMNGWARVRGLIAKKQLKVRLVVVRRPVETGMPTPLNPCSLDFTVGAGAGYHEVAPE